MTEEDAKSSAVERDELFVAVKVCWDISGNPNLDEISTFKMAEHDTLGTVVTKAKKSMESKSLDEFRVRLWKPMNEKERKESESGDGWVLVNEAELKICATQLEIDSDEICNFMLEKSDANGFWLRKVAIDWRSNLDINVKLDVFDKLIKKWYPATVIETSDVKGIRTHFDGYSDIWDEWHLRTGEFIAELYTHTKPSSAHWNDNSFGNSGSTMSSSNWNANSGFTYNDTMGAPSNRGCVGLKNMGNTCYLNSVLHCLLHCPLFADYFASGDEYLTAINRENPLGFKGAVAEAFGAFAQKYWSDGYSCLAPHDLKSVIGSVQERFASNQQQDASEFLLFTLDSLHEDMNQITNKPYSDKIESNGDPDTDLIAAESEWTRHLSRNKSFIVDLFQGQIRNYLKCPDCNTVSVSFDPFMFLTVPIPNADSGDSSNSNSNSSQSYVSPDDVVKSVLVISLKDKPKRYHIKVPKYATMIEFKIETSKAANIDVADRLIFCEIFNKRIFTIFKDYESVDRMRSHEIIVAYEVPIESEMAEIFEGAHKWKLTYIYHQQIVENSWGTGANQYKIEEKIGFPLIIRLPVDYEMMSRVVAEYVTQLLHPFFLLSNFEEWQKVFSVDAERLDGSNSGDDKPATTDEAISEKGPIIIKPYSLHCVKESSQSNCCFCQYSDHCSGCDLSIRDTVTIADNSMDWDKIAIVARWRLSATQCFNHDAFIAPINDVSTEKYALENSSFTSNDFFSPSSFSSTRSVPLSECLDELAKEEQLSDLDAYYCRKCEQHRQMKKQMYLWRLPNILIIHLKRFKQNGYFRDKNDTSVEYPITEFDLSNAIHPNSPIASNTVYDLFGVCRHRGGIGAGHYTAYVKNKDGKDQQWYEFDDSFVTPITNSQIVNQSAYLLFYHRRQTSDPISSDDEQKM